jgi:hypothetical protein
VTTRKLLLTEVEKIPTPERPIDPFEQVLYDLSRRGLWGRLARELYWTPDGQNRLFRLKGDLDG